MKKHLLFTLLLLISIGLLVGQTWIRYYPFGDLCPGPSDNASSEACNVIPAIGGGYLLQGYVEFVYGDIPLTLTMYSGNSMKMAILFGGERGEETSHLTA